MVVTAFIFSQQLLWQAGALLVSDEAPRKADIEVVLGGDATGSRILKACELLEAGFVPRALVSGAGGYYGTHESLLAIDYAVRRGCPREGFLPFKYPATSTFEEAQQVVPELRRMGVHNVIVVTSPSHTARAGRIFRHLAPELEIHMVSSNDRRWNDGYWWKSRESRKVWLLESTKTIAGFFGL